MQAACHLEATELPVTMSGLRPLVPVTINERSVYLLVDSGAFYSVLSPASAAQLHLQLRPMRLQLGGVAGNASASMASVQHFALANATLPDVSFLVGGTDPGGGAAGLLGQNVLRRSDVEYDLGNGVIRLMHAEDCGHKPLAYWARSVPYSVLDFEPDTMLFFGTHSLRRGVILQQPYVVGAVGVAYLNGVKIRVLFDTGSDHSLLTLRAAARAGVKPDSAGVLAAGGVFGIGQGGARTWIGRFESFRIGGEQTLHTRLRFADVRLGAGADMVLGADFFLSHRIYVANSQRKLYFTYNGGPVFDLTPASGVGGQGAIAGPEPADAAGFSRRGGAFYARQQWARAIADFTRACELDPAQPEYFYQRGLAYWDDKQSKLALADFDRAVQLAPDYVGPRLARAEVHLDAGDEAAAAADLEAVAKLAPKQSDLRLQIASDDVAADRFGAAIDQYDLWEASHPSDARLALALSGRCWARALAGVELAKATRDCTRALHLNPRSPSALASRGVVRLREGEYAKSLSDVEAALRQDPNDSWALYARAIDELRLGRAGAARADLAAATAADGGIGQRARRYGILP